MTPSVVPAVTLTATCCNRVLGLEVERKRIGGGGATFNLVAA